MLSTVERPSTSAGRTISTVGSRAVFDSSAAMEMWMPGVMIPPRYSFSLVTAQSVVAVPKSTISRLRPGKRASAPMALAILSAPTSNGLR